MLWCGQSRKRRLKPSGRKIRWAYATDRDGLSPLEITTDQKLILGEKQLILTNAVRDYTVEMTVDHVTEVISHGHSVTDTYTGGGTAQPVEHSHPYKGRKSFRVHLGLKMGEKVILVRCDGGQQFVSWTDGRHRDGNFTNYRR